jgi:hypothetical protein
VRAKLTGREKESDKADLNDVRRHAGYDMGTGNRIKVFKC